jgi:hypothetical protein
LGWRRDAAPPWRFNPLTCLRRRSARSQHRACRVPMTTPGWCRDAAPPPGCQMPTCLRRKSAPQPIGTVQVVARITGLAPQAGHRALPLRAARRPYNGAASFLLPLRAARRPDNGAASFPLPILIGNIHYRAFKPLYRPGERDKSRDYTYHPLLGLWKRISAARLSQNLRNCIV